MTDQSPYRLLFSWVWVAGIFLSGYAYLNHGEQTAGGQACLGVSKVFQGIKWLKFHEVNAPAQPSEKQIVVIGSSNLAGLGHDYRANTRQKVDPWGRSTFSTFLESELARGGLNYRVANLAVNGGRLRSQLFLFLYALERKPDVIVLGMSHWTLNRDGDFRHPKPMQGLNSELLARVNQASVPQSVLNPIQNYLATQPCPAFKENLQVSWWDQILASVACRLRGVYLAMQLPPIREAPIPRELASEVEKGLAELGRSPSALPEQVSPVFQEMTELFPSVLNFMKALADAGQVRLIFLIPPTSYPWVNSLYEARKKDAETAGLEVMDLRGAGPLSTGETYDGHHYTSAGNRCLAERFVENFKQP